MDQLVLLSDFLAPIATLALAAYVAYRDTRHMHEEDVRIEEAKKLEQPSSIAAWLEGDVAGDARVVLRNDSNLPVYETVVTVVVTKGHGCNDGEQLEGHSEWRRQFAVIPPGRFIAHIDLRGFGGMHSFPVLEIAFTCADGSSWIRRGNGSLEPIESSPTLHYGIGLPTEFNRLDSYSD